MPRALRLLGRGATTNMPRPTGAVAVDPPSMPVGLNAAERRAWEGLQAELSAIPGLISRADRGVCELVARLEPMIRAAAVVVRKHGSTLTCLDKAGQVKFVQTRPEATFLLKTGALLKGLYAELSLSPSGRSRVNVTPSPKPSRLDTYLQERSRGA